jgi:hypothetical protein
MALARRQPPPPPVDMSNPAVAFAQLARDKTIDADRLEKLIHLQERIMDRNAKMAFNAAFTAMSDQLPVIKRNGRITDKHGNLRSRYSKYEDIQRVCKPVLKAHGFAIRHRTEWPTDKPGTIRVVGILAHLEGHSEESAFEAPPDKNDYRTAIQDEGSTVSYGRRYTTIDVLNLEQEGVDNDGQGTENRKRASAPPRASGQPSRGSSEDVPRGSQPTPARPVPPAGRDARRDAVISDAQRKRLWVIARKANRSDAELKDWLVARYGIASSKLITRRNYNDICNAIESPGALPLREPGEEG